MVLRELREMLAHIQVRYAHLYRAHDSRRGHADALCRSGAGLTEILEAGEWRSPAFLSYLRLQDLECAAVVEAHRDDSSDEDA